MIKRTILICFDNGKWIQDYIEYDENNLEQNDVLIHRYIDSYIDKKNTHSLLKEVAPSIIYAFFID